MAEHAVDHPAHRAVAAVHDDQVDPVRDGRLCEFGAVTAVVGVFDGELQAALERMASRSRPAGVVEVAVGFTISTARMMRPA